MAEINKDLLLSRIIHSRDLTALEKRYLETLLERDEPVQWKLEPMGMHENINTGKKIMCYRHICACGYHTGNQGRRFRFCPKCGKPTMIGGASHVDKTDR